MPGRNRTSHLIRVLARAVHPVCLIDDRSEIVFVNQAMADWTGVPAAELEGQKCQYHSGVGEPEPQTVANQICPPPVTMTGVESTSELMFGPSEKELQRRLVRYIPFRAAEEEVAGVLVMAGEPLPPETAERVSTPTIAARLLHERIQRLRRQHRQPFLIDRLLGETAAIQRVREQAALAASTASSVLIVGPPGSGREHVARAIHSADPQRAHEPFVPLACILVGGELLRSTVAALLDRDGPGRATLLLNEIDQLSPVDQADLPGLLSAASGKIRFLSTAQASLTALAAQGRFLSLAAHQLSTLVIELPPLAQRISDLPLLAQQFLEHANARGSKQLGSFSEEALDLLAAYPWTKDMDELQQVIDEAHAACHGIEITVADLPPSLRQSPHAAAYPQKPEEPIDLESFLGRIELELIQRAMAKARGNKSKAAQLLGLTRPRLYRRLVQLGLVDEIETEGSE